MSYINYCVLEKGVEPFSNEHHQDMATCYGNIADVLDCIDHSKFNGIKLRLNTDEWDEECYTNKNPVIYWNAEAYGAWDSIGADKQEASHRMYQELVKPWIDEYYSGMVDITDRFITFDKELPFLMVVLVTSFFRINLENSFMLLNYQYLRDEKKYQPWTAYWGSSFLKSDLKSSKYAYVEYIYEHIPFKSYIHPDVIKSVIKAPERFKELESSSSEVRNTEYLDYSNRSDFFLGSYYTRNIVDYFEYLKRECSDHNYENMTHDSYYKILDQLDDVVTETLLEIENARP